MEIFNNELVPFVAFAFAVPVLILAIGLAFKRRSERRFRESMKRGNEIYRDWRSDTEKQPLE